MQPFPEDKIMIEIRQASTPDDLQAVYRFRYAVYVEEMAWKLKHVNHTAKLLTDPLDVPDALVLAAWDGGEVVGTLRNNLLRCSDIGEDAEYYSLANLSPEQIAAASITTRLMVYPRYRGTTLATRLACEAFRFGLERGVAMDFIDCRAQLLAYYTRFGYRPLRTDFVHPEFGPTTVMRLDLMDRPHLDAIRSPFRKIYHSWLESCSETSERAMALTADRRKTWAEEPVNALVDSRGARPRRLGAVREAVAA